MLTVVNKIHKNPPKKYIQQKTAARKNAKKRNKR